MGDQQILPQLAAVMCRMIGGEPASVLGSFFFGLDLGVIQIIAGLSFQHVDVVCYLRHEVRLVLTVIEPNW